MCFQLNLVNFADFIVFFLSKGQIKSKKKSWKKLGNNQNITSNEN